jgi:Uma2 family endonuclease
MSSCIARTAIRDTIVEKLVAVNPTLPVLLTVADLESLPDDGNRYEIVDGELFVSTSPSFFHQKVLMAIAFALAEYLRKHPIGEIVPGVGVIFDDHNAVIPDLVYISRARMPETVVGGRLVRAPEIAVEILSPGASNERRDRHVKLNLYSSWEVKEYWIVDPENRAVEIYRHRSGKLKVAARLQPGDLLTSPQLPGFSAPVESFFPN